jgi:hypothetical protein
MGAMLELLGSIYLEGLVSTSIDVPETDRQNVSAIMWGKVLFAKE